VVHQSSQAAERLVNKQLWKHRTIPRVKVSSKLKFCAVANREMELPFEQRQLRGLHNQAENARQPNRIQKEIAPMRINV
jgi:transposase-like protein